jgi:hypothetical protein
MRKFYAYIFLAIMLNVILFHSMDSADKDAYIATQDPINSIAEFVIEVWFDVPDTQPGDERQTESGHFKLAKVIGTTCPVSAVLLRKNYLILNLINSSEVFTIPTFSIAISNPPPEFTV